MEIPAFGTKKELFDFLVKNQVRIMAAKKAVPKYSDAFSMTVAMVDGAEQAAKANSPVSDDVDTLKVRAIINTTNLMDGHKDVHIPGLWSKSLKENRNIMHLQEHEMKFASIIADGPDLKAYTKTYSWKELGQDYEGDTQALVFDSQVDRDRNKFMFSQYKAGRVKNHSVGMIYVKLLMAVNDKDYKEEYANWKKYIDQVANKEQAEAVGYFFPVLEAKVIEGSAVPIGSNWATPTLDNNMKEEPLQDTPKIEPVESTHEIDVMKLIYERKILI